MGEGAPPSIKTQISKINADSHENFNPLGVRITSPVLLKLGKKVFIFETDVGYANRKNEFIFYRK